MDLSSCLQAELYGAAQKNLSGFVAAIEQATPHKCLVSTGITERKKTARVLLALRDWHSTYVGELTERFQPSNETMAKDTVSLFNKYTRGLFRKATKFSPEHVQMKMPSEGGKQSRVSTKKAKQANKEVEKQDANAQVLTIETPDEPQPLTQPLISCSAFEFAAPHLLRILAVLACLKIDSSTLLSRSAVLVCCALLARTLLRLLAQWSTSHTVLRDLKLHAALYTAVHTANTY